MEIGHSARAEELNHGVHDGGEGEIEVDDGRLWLVLVPSVVQGEGEEAAVSKSAGEPAAATKDLDGDGGRVQVG